MMRCILLICAVWCVMFGKASVRDEWPVLKTYEGENLRRVKMPVGGIGTGTISLAGRGALVDWQLCNRPDIGHTPACHHASSAFWLRTKDADGRVAARLLEGPVDSELYEGQEGAPVANHGFPRFRHCRFKTAYPLAQVELKDGSLPVAATLEAMNPLVPGDVAASSLPVALLRWRLVNMTDLPVGVSVLGFIVSPAGDDIDRSAVATNGLRGAQIGSSRAKDVRDRGDVALVVPETAGEVSVATRVDDPGWMVKQDRFWKQFCATGRAADYHDSTAKSVEPVVAVSVRLELAPHATASVPFVLCWRYPNRMDWNQKVVLGNHYATQFATPAEAAARLVDGLEAYERQTVAFVRSVCGRAAPDVVQEAALFSLTALRTETCFRTADGHFFGWEGIFDKKGSCFGSCTHVWGYEHALVDLWPSLAKDMAEIQFGPMSDERGHMAFRVGLPLGEKARGWATAAADGQMQCIVKAYEIWKKTGDGVWLRRLYPRIRKAVSYAWVPGGWDADRDGVMEGCQHNTMDVEYYGPNPQMEFLYLAALKAVAAMSDYVGEGAFADDCRNLVSRGQAWTEENLFNGSYYEHKVVPPTGAVEPGTTQGNAKDLKNPDYQLGAGCLVDQLLGDYASRAVGLGPVADVRHAERALDTILRRNASGNFAGAYNCGREYAFSDEPALKMAWYPEGRMPGKPFPYYGENMTGFEYVVAANLAQRGRLEEAERVVRNIRSRYDGRKRNPFDEAECGHHYARAMAAWTVLQSWRK